MPCHSGLLGELISFYLAFKHIHTNIQIYMHVYLYMYVYANTYTPELNIYILYI